MFTTKNYQNFIELKITEKFEFYNTKNKLKT